MTARRLNIVGKSRDNPAFPLASLTDFQFEEAEQVDPRIIIEQPTVSLYCVDHENRQAIFVELPSDVDLSQAPFYYQTQYEAARSLIAVPYGTLHTLARDVTIDPSRIILVYSTGRCGSTLVSRVLNEADGVYSFAEPDVFSQLVAIRGFDGSNDAEIGPLVRDCTKVMCEAVQRLGASAWAFKFRSFGIELGDLFYQHFPTAKAVFLYRTAVDYSRSAVRAFRLFEPDIQGIMPEVQHVFSQLARPVAAYSSAHPTPIPPLELNTCMWVGVMERCLELQAQGVPMFCARYEELKTMPHAMLDALFSYCRLTVSDGTGVARVLAQDSQAGTELSQMKAQQSTSILTDEHVEELHRLIKHYAPTLSSDSIVPYTFQLS